MLKIEKGVPMWRGRGIPGKSVCDEVPWSDLRIGDSVLVPNEIVDQYRNPSGTLTGAAHARGIRLRVRSEPGGIRIWRTK